jgi:ectoine hydroxylase-related dioxygenase (phytanoyl-CoA dioxygenase family)
MMTFLTDQHLSRYEREGFLFFPEFLSTSEVETLQAELPSIFAEDTPRRVLEEGGQVVRSVYGSHMTNDAFRKLSEDPRLVGPAVKLLGSEVYIHQFKINAKAIFGGDKWEWHQDYVFWRKEDGMPTARVANVALFLNQVNEFNGPLLLIPGSHQEDVIDVNGRAEIPDAYLDSPAWITNLTAQLKYALPRETVTKLVNQYGIVAPKGPAGSLLIFHGNLVHGSVQNISPFERTIVCITYNSIHNTLPVSEKMRPQFLANRDYTPIKLEAAASHPALSQMKERQ